MKKCNYHFYTENAEGIRTYVHIGAYKQPERSEQWKSLTEQLNEGKAHLIGYEPYERKQNFNN